MRRQACGPTIFSISDTQRLPELQEFHVSSAVPVRTPFSIGSHGVHYLTRFGRLHCDVSPLCRILFSLRMRMLRSSHCILLLLYGDGLSRSAP